ncbi:NUDIX hydrolase [Halobacteriovorax sp. CON-3]|uniref:NUDIX hydrolase n=1 Tax=Halobacteriovorax sp. CON-3 TaxID=3157710 RepID=UPI003722899A
MRMIKSTIHPDIGPRESIEEKSVFKRLATRAIALNGEMILMLYTERYDDYSLPGGGLDSGEDIKAGMIRELKEETGAQNIREIKEFGIYEEFRPWYKPDFDIQHMISYCFTCFVDYDLGQTQLEHYEVNNGMKPKWINIHDAIAHNEQTIASSEKKGMSIERETYLLKLIREEFL